MNYNPMSDVATIRRIALYLGCGTLMIAAFMSAKFGMSMSVLHGLLLGALTIAGSIIWPYIGHLQAAGFTKKAGLYMAVGLLFLGVELFSHVGFTNGQRTMNVEQTGVVNASYKTKQDSVERNAALLETYKKQLSELQAENAWAATVSADGLRARILPMDEAIRQETARGGCGPICLGLTKDKATLEDKIAVVEKVDKLTDAVNAAQKIVNAKEAEATTATFTSSPVVAQTGFVAQMWTMSLEPGAGERQGTQIGISFLLALVTTFLAPVLISIAFGPIEYVPGARMRATKAEGTGGFATTAQNAVHEQIAALREAIALMQRPASVAVSAAPGPAAAPAERHTHEKTHEREVVMVPDSEWDKLRNWARQCSAGAVSAGGVRLA